jgi:hypothetical protein
MISFIIFIMKLQVERILSSVELVWLKWAFFTYWRIYNTAGWKNTFSEAKIANKKSVLSALLKDRISGEVSYA